MKENMCVAKTKTLFKYLIYISLAFLAVALYKADYLKVPTIVSFPAMSASFLFLFAGFITGAVAWKHILKKSGYAVDWSECLAGVGLSIFSKYIPGKVWVIVGKAAYIAKNKQYSLGNLSVISLNSQFITLWVGLSIGSIGLLLLDGLHLRGWFILLIWLGLSVVIFSRLAHDISERLITSVLKKNMKIPSLDIKSTLTIMPWFVLYWTLFSIGFYLLIVSLTTIDIPFSIGLGFPLSATLGIMAIIFPGGLGAREGAIVSYLTLSGIPIAEAAAIAVASRLWFLVGEIFIFIVGWIAHKKSQKKLQPQTDHSPDC